MKIESTPVIVIPDMSPLIHLAAGFAEDRGLITSAEDTWNSIVSVAAGASPSQNVQVVRPTQLP